eukprot:375719-Rhodomonas_salina.1
MMLLTQRLVTWTNSSAQKSTNRRMDSRVMTRMMMAIAVTMAMAILQHTAMVHDTDMAWMLPNDCRGHCLPDDDRRSEMEPTTRMAVGARMRLTMLLWMERRTRCCARTQPPPSSAPSASSRS